MVVQKEQGRVHPLWIFACKGFYKVEKKSQGPQVAWGLDVGTGCCRTSKEHLEKKLEEIEQAQMKN